MTMARWQKLVKQDLDGALRFGARVRELRTHAGISVNKLASIAGVSPSTISRLERGNIAPSREHINLISTALGLSKSEAKKLAELVDLYEYEKTFPVSGNRMAEIQEIFRRREAEADEIRGFSWSYMPGLVQTRAYMAACFSMQDKKPEIVEAACVARQKRQEILSQNKQIQMVISEYALVCRITTRAAHLEQLDHLIHLSNVEAIEIGVLPLEASPSFCIPCSFWIYDTSGGVCDAFEWDACVWEPDKIQKMLLLFSQIKAASAFGRKFTNLVQEAKGRI